MKAFFKRLCALSCCAALVCSLVPAAALASDDSSANNTQGASTETASGAESDAGAVDEASASGDDGATDGTDGGTTDGGTDTGDKTDPAPGPVIVTKKVYTSPAFVGKVKVAKSGSKIYKISIPRVRFTVKTLNAETGKLISTKKSSIFAFKVEVCIPGKGWKKADVTSSGKYYSYNAGKDSYIQAVRISPKSGSKFSKYLKQSGKKLYYCATVKSFGTLGWAKFGQKAGTSGQSCALTKFKLKLAKKVPGSTAHHYFSAPTVKYQVRYKGKSSWTGNKKNGVTSGKESWKVSISGLSAKLSNKEYSGGIKYRVRCSKKEGSKYWTSWVANGKKTNTSKKSKVQAISMKLSGKMAKMYDVYYRVYCGDHHWLGWAKNGQLTGSKKINYPIGGVQVELVAKGCAAPGSTKGLMRSKLPTSNGGELSMLRRAQSYSSGTNYLILVNRGAHRVAVFTGSKGNWKLKRYWSCVTGKPSTPTITGTFRTTGLKLGHLPDWSNARYATHIYGGYYFHTTLSGSWELGSSASHGCIRIAVSNAIWVYNNIPGGTTVNIYN